MSKETERREEKIPPCRIDKNLIHELGTLLALESQAKEKPRFTLEATTLTRESEDINKFLERDIPQNTNEITLKIGGWKSPRNIEIYLGIRTQRSKLKVWGDNPTWVSGVYDRIFTIFKKSRLEYYLIPKFEWLRGIISSLAILPLTLKDS